MHATSIRLKRRGLRILPDVEFTGEGNIDIAMAAHDAVEPMLLFVDGIFARQVAACPCNGTHCVIVSVGAFCLDNLGLLFFVVRIVVLIQNMLF